MVNKLLEEFKVEAEKTPNLLQEVDLAIDYLSKRLAQLYLRRRSGRMFHDDLVEGELGADQIFYTVIDWHNDKIKELKNLKDELEKE